jgi:hypothetical protein
MKSSSLYSILLLAVGMSGFGWLFTFPDHREIVVNHTVNMTNKLVTTIYDNDDTRFIHNFCESRLQDNKAPEVWNTVTSFAISIVPFVYGFPKYPLLYNVACMLSFNGVASAYYHYTLSWFGKQADEVSMILANYFGIWALINMYYQRSTKRNNLNRFNTLFMYIFLITNTLVKYDILFPTVFGIYVGGSLIMIVRVANTYDVPCVKNLTISCMGAISWIVSESYCTEYTMFGHVFWHLLFPYGFYRLILEFDKIKQRLPVLDRIDE